MTVDLARVEAASIPDAHRANPVRAFSQLIASSLFAGGSVMAMLALIGLYLATRHATLASHAEWIPAGGLPLTAPNTALFTMLLSIPAMVWAQQAIRNDDRQSLWVAFGIVVLLGSAFINAESYILTNLHLSGAGEASVGITESNVALLLFTVVGVHLAMVVASLVSILVTVLRSLGGRGDSHDSDSVDAVALYWYVTVAMFVIVWYAVYVTK